LIADVYNGDNPYLEDVIERQMVINRLGYRLDKTANLDKSSLEKTFEACKQFKAKIDKCNPEKVIFIATSAARDAKNSDELINGVEKILGIKPKIINGETEALYSFLGVISSVKKKLTNLSVVIDIGGGSTEIALGGSALASAYSMQAGSIRVAELFFDASSSNYSLPPNLEQINAAEKFIDYELDKAIKHIFESKSAKEPLKNENKITIFGVAGTITTICANALHLDKYDSKKIDKASLDLKQVFASCDELKIMNYEQLKALPFMHPGRIDSMAAGAVIYKRVLQRLQYEFSKYNIEIATTITSEKDILDGVALFSASKSPIS
jgi:exopolyphosphatase/guanosine-5'-triphosphate,3'-diphosphate pyrophosphatase